GRTPVATIRGTGRSDPECVMSSLLPFATSPTADELAAQLKVANDYVKPHVFALYLLAGQFLLYLLWRAYRRVVPAPPDEQRAPLSFALLLVVGQVVLVAAWGPLTAGWESLDRITRADLVIIVHFGFVLFVVLYQLAIFIGWP